MPICSGVIKEKAAVADQTEPAPDCDPTKPTHPTNPTNQRDPDGH